MFANYQVRTLEATRQDSLVKIAGDVVASPDPGKALKVWREKLGIKQVQLARVLKLSPSVLSDYESGRRPSPGVIFVKKYIEALVSLDEAQGRVASRLLSPEKLVERLSVHRLLFDQRRRHTFQFVAVR